MSTCTQTETNTHRYSTFSQIYQHTSSGEILFCTNMHEIATQTSPSLIHAPIHANTVLCFSWEACKPTRGAPAGSQSQPMDLAETTTQP